MRTKVWSVVGCLLVILLIAVPAVAAAQEDANSVNLEFQGGWNCDFFMDDEGVMHAHADIAATTGGPEIEVSFTQYLVYQGPEGGVYSSSTTTTTVDLPIPSEASGYGVNFDLSNNAYAYEFELDPQDLIKESDETDNVCHFGPQPFWNYHIFLPSIAR